MAFKLLASTLSFCFLVTVAQASCPSLSSKSSFHPAKVQAGKYASLDIKLSTMHQRKLGQSGLVLKVTLPDEMKYVGFNTTPKSKKGKGRINLVQHGANLYFENIPALLKTDKFQIKVRVDASMKL